MATTSDVEAFAQDLINRMNSNLPGVVAALPRLQSVLDSIPEQADGADAALAGVAAVAGKARQVFAAIRADRDIPEAMVEKALRNVRIALADAQIGLLQSVVGATDE